MSNVIITNREQHIIGLGNPKAKVVFYLPTPPAITGVVNTTIDIIEQNGNHWRKILTILAKLVCGSHDWREYRDNDLLANVYLNFEQHQIGDHNILHCVCGKAHWQALGQEPERAGFIQCAALGKAWSRQQTKNEPRLLLVPYPDYRQFNNALIAQLKADYF